MSGLDRAALATQTGPVPVSWLHQVEDLARRRAEGEPLQYLTGVAGFRHLELAVGPGVFIPRPETESLVEYAIARLPEGGIVVDVGTGSGAVALALADERRDATVYATERFEDALTWATRNRDALGLPVHLLRGDLLEPLPADLERSVDVITSNPPYVAEEERTALPVDVIDHEPHEALFSGPGGVDLIERIVDDAPRWLRPGGWLILEMGEHQRTQVLNVLQGRGWLDAVVHQDLLGRPRIAEARWGEA
ncbi:MAG: release factor glutamine methyltransferase [Actinomycetota bacterium]|nr:release factor glutamine methyltransferase [Actinomycetota bacterium]